MGRLLECLPLLHVQVFAQLADTAFRQECPIPDLAVAFVRKVAMARQPVRAPLAHALALALRVHTAARLACPAQHLVLDPVPLVAS